MNRYRVCLPCQVNNQPSMDAKRTLARFRLEHSLKSERRCFKAALKRVLVSGCPERASSRLTTVCLC